MIWSIGPSCKPHSLRMTIFHLKYSVVTVRERSVLQSDDIMLTYPWAGQCSSITSITCDLWPPLFLLPFAFSVFHDLDTSPKLGRHNQSAVTSIMIHVSLIGISPMNKMGINKHWLFHCDLCCVSVWSILCLSNAPKSCLPNKLELCVCVCVFLMWRSEVCVTMYVTFGEGDVCCQGVFLVLSLITRVSVFVKGDYRRDYGVWPYTIFTRG